MGPIEHSEYDIDTGILFVVAVRQMRLRSKKTSEMTTYERLKMRASIFLTGTATLPTIPSQESPANAAMRIAGYDGVTRARVVVVHFTGSIDWNICKNREGEIGVVRTMDQVRELVA